MIELKILFIGNREIDCKLIDHMFNYKKSKSEFFDKIQLDSHHLEKDFIYDNKLNKYDYIFVKDPKILDLIDMREHKCVIIYEKKNAVSEYGFGRQQAIECLRKGLNNFFGGCFVLPQMINGGDIMEEEIFLQGLIDFKNT